MIRDIKISTGSLEQSTDHFIEAWHKAERGDALEPETRLVFDDLGTLLRVLTPTRWTLLQTLRRCGPTSVRALAQTLERDYKNVHTDVRELERTGLITRSRDNRIEVPWDLVEAQVKLVA